MKYKMLIISGLVLTLISCKTYTISPDSLKSQLTRADNNEKEVKVNNPLLFGELKYLANDIETLDVIDKKGNQLSIPNSPRLEMRITHKNGEKYVVYFDTAILENDTLKASRSRFMPNLRRSILFDSIVKIEIQDGRKNFNYKN